jgi:glycosyltransferase involved in cell wall biosynthesis
MIGVIVTTHNRPSALERSLPQIVALGAPVLVVDDGSNSECVRANADITVRHGACQLWLPNNRGLAAALNAGLSYWLADKRIEWISYFQDDVDVHPSLFTELAKVARETAGARLFTGHNSPDHPAIEKGRGIVLKRTCAGVHLHARSDFWAGVMPIPTLELGAPKRIPGRVRGLGSNVDWWIVRDSPRSVANMAVKDIVCLPGLVRTFLFKAEDSSWGNAPRCGEDAPLRWSL